MRKFLSLFIVICMLTISGCAGSSGYSIRCTAEDGNPVEGVQIQLCTENTCQMLKSGQHGVAFFDVKPGEYEVKVVSVPDGYALKGADTVITDKKENKYEFVFSKATQDVKVQEDTSGVKAMGKEASAQDETSKNRYHEMSYLKDIDLTGVKVIMVNYWEPWCGFCINEMPDLEKLYRKYRDQGLLIVGMFADEENAREAIEYTGVTYPNVRLPQDSMYTELGYPTTLFVDTDGNILPPEAGDENTNGNCYIGSRGYDDWEKIIVSKLAK